MERVGVSGFERIAGGDFNVADIHFEKAGEMIGASFAGFAKVKHLELIKGGGGLRARKAEGEKENGGELFHWLSVALTTSSSISLVKLSGGQHKASLQT